MTRFKFILFTISICISAVCTSFAAMPDRISRPEDGSKAVFIYTYTNNKPWKSLTDYTAKDEQLFGKEIAQQICLIDHTYVIFSSNNEMRPKIVKPIIYNALHKLRQHYISLIKNEPGNTQPILEEYSSILTKGFVCYYEETRALEALLQKSKNAREIKNIFDQITIKVISE